MRLHGAGEGHVVCKLAPAYKLAVFQYEDPFALAFSPTGSELAVGDPVGRVNIYDTKTRTRLITTKIVGVKVGALAFSPNGQELTIGGEDKIYFWNLQSKKPGHKQDIRYSHVGFTPLEFVTYSKDRSVRVWRNLETKDGGGGGTVSVDLVWGSNIGMLGASGMRLEGVVGLDDTSRKLLKQRGAVGGVLLSKEDEVDAASEEEWETDEEYSGGGGFWS
ncbi:hypothetical protein BGZ91_011228 [Linnemannia elongata]|nr:hypothetical protein BGZ91_011228 [Linnemannia elongata]